VLAPAQVAEIIDGLAGLPYEQEPVDQLGGHRDGLYVLLTASSFARNMCGPAK
jgi:hypothetical protein